MHSIEREVMLYKCTYILECHDDFDPLSNTNFTFELDSFS